MTTELNQGGRVAMVALGGQVESRGGRAATDLKTSLNLSLTMDHLPVASKVHVVGFYGSSLSNTER